MHAVGAGMALAVLTPLFAFAAPERQFLPPSDNLRDGEGVALVRENCLDCHDDSYIISAKLGREDWDGVLELMLGMGMPPLDAEVREQILDYLESTQGAGAEKGTEADPSAGEPAPDLPWANPRYRPNPLYWRERG